MNQSIAVIFKFFSLILHIYFNLLYKIKCGEHSGNVWQGLNYLTLDGS